MIHLNTTIIHVAPEGSPAHIELGEGGFYNGAIALDIQPGIKLDGGATYPKYTIQKVNDHHYEVIESEERFPYYLILSTRRVSSTRREGDGHIYGTNCDEGNYLVLASAAEIDGKGSIDERRCETRIIELKQGAKAAFCVDFGDGLSHYGKLKYYCFTGDRIVVANTLISTIRPNLTVGGFIERLGGLVEI